MQSKTNTNFLLDCVRKELIELKLFFDAIFGDFVEQIF